MAQQRVVVITGASRGLGLALASQFAGNGWQVIGTGRSPQPGQFPDGATYHSFDAGDAAACGQFWQEIAAKAANADFCLVNNAGGYVSGGLLESPLEAYEQMMRSCYFSAVYMTRGLAAVVPKARIINIISSSALRAHRNNAAYGAAKAAEMHFFQALQAEFEPTRYQITNLYPSDIATHGPNEAAINAEELARFVREQAESTATYYLRDVTMYPSEG